MERYLIHFVIKRKEAIAYLYEQMFPEPYFHTDYRAKYIFARPLLWTYLYVSMNFTLFDVNVYIIFLDIVIGWFLAFIL